MDNNRLLNKKSTCDLTNDYESAMQCVHRLSLH